MFLFPPDFCPLRLAAAGLTCVSRRRVYQIVRNLLRYIPSPEVRRGGRRFYSTADIQSLRETLEAGAATTTRCRSAG